jgi:hypothetical protein
MSLSKPQPRGTQPALRLTGLSAIEPGAMGSVADVTVEDNGFVLVAHTSGVDGGAWARALIRLHPSASVASIPVLLPASADEPEAEQLMVLTVPAGIACAVRSFPSVARVTWPRAAAMVASLARDVGTTAEALDPRRDAHLVLTSHLGGVDLVVAALASSPPGLGLVGGTGLGPAVTLGGGVCSDGAAVVLMRGEQRPVRTVRSHPYHLTETRVVVTAMEGGLVTGLDGQPALERFASLAGVSHEFLAQPSDVVLGGLQVQLGWFLAGHLVIRPVRGVGDGGGLEVGGVVDVGAVLRLLRRAEDPLETMLSRLRLELEALPHPVRGGWVFACHGLLQPPYAARFEAGLAELGLVGLGTDAQQWGPVSTCQTLSGVVWGGDA